MHICLCFYFHVNRNIISILDSFENNLCILVSGGKKWLNCFSIIIDKKCCFKHVALNFWFIFGSRIGKFTDQNGSRSWSSSLFFKNQNKQNKNRSENVNKWIVSSVLYAVQYGSSQHLHRWYRVERPPEGQGRLRV